MPKFIIRYGLNYPGEWEEIEAGNEEDAENEAYRLALEEAESCMYYEVKETPKEGSE